MPWQQRVADVAGEIDPATGRFIYRKVVVLVPRQSGKTTLDLSENVYRCVGFKTPQMITYTAQTRNDARLKFMAQEETLLRPSPFRSKYKLREAPGSEGIKWTNGSHFGLASTTEKSGHGPTLDKGTIDEAFAQTDNRSEQAMRPAMITRDAQLWVFSTAGTANSVYLNAEIEKGRARVESGQYGSVAYFEFSAGPDDDPDDELTWWRTMPALGRTAPIESVRAEHDDMKPRDFARAYLNITDNGPAADSVVDPDKWEAMATLTHLVGKRAFALDVRPDRTWAAVSWAGTDENGENLAEVIKHERGTGWIIPYFVEKFDRNPLYARRVYMVAGKQAALMAADFETAGIDLVLLSRLDYATACADYYDGVENETVFHRATGQMPLETAIAGAAWTTGDARVWNVVKSTADICPLVAATIANWGFALEAKLDYDIEDSIA